MHDGRYSMPLTLRLTPAVPGAAAHAPAAAFLRFALPFLLLFAASLACAAEIAGLVVRVTDGDTVTVLDSSHMRYKVRLVGIDAPERHQPFGARSQQHLAALVDGKDVIVIWHKHDRYGRILGRVLAPECDHGACANTLDTGLAQLSAGLAWHYKQYQREQEPGERKSYTAAEQTARTKQEGLWQDASPVAPWDYRRATRLAASAAHSGSM